ncbi:hypothetical protein PISMIDRAFT_615374 [Pisolithus microcarpus 441]|uniref:Uncharacterized protein n=1 Tax=Pisolithus microcarpus 441 TaxID=765257 RepID=A0A0C9Z0Z2_9AGAM|nr:hypothetical protein PISMIDRAFT_615374 [Pisolithus microcarpus 441]
MHADLVHCLYVALGSIGCEWSHSRWCWMHADHVHCLPVALGFIGSEWSGGGCMLTMFTATLLHLGS